jgi:hypothetical protein
MNYPGHLVRSGENDAALIGNLQHGLQALGYGPFTTGVFDDSMSSLVRLFQSQHVDGKGRPLDADGVVGPLTWTAIFGAGTAPGAVTEAPNALARRTVEVAVAEIGVREEPLGSNRGPRVDQYLDSVGIPPGQGTANQRFWCMAFVYFCVSSASHALGIATPLARTAGVMDQWERCRNRPGVRRITRAEALAEPARVQPGQVLILDHGHGQGHTGIIVAVDLPHLSVVEGNASGSVDNRNGVGVFRTEFRKIDDKQVAGLLAFD